MTDQATTVASKFSGPETLLDLAKLLTADELFTVGPVKAFPRLQGSDVRILIAHGENAAGKSLVLRDLRKHVGSYDRNGVETFSVSMRMRTSDSMGAGMMYMSERNRSTGTSSVKAVQGAFYNACSRPHPVWLVLDEPDVGLSDRYAAALGAYIADQINHLPNHIRGVLLVSHSRCLLRRLLCDLKQAPHEVAMGEDQTLVNYLNRPIEEEASIADLDVLLKRGQETFKFIYDFEQAKKAGEISI